MNKKTFTKFIKRIVELKVRQKKLTNYLEYFSDGYINIFTQHEDLLVDILREAMNDTSDWIGDFLYERGCKFPKKTVVWDKNKKPLKYKSYSDLYNLIKKI